MLGAITLVPFCVLQVCLWDDRNQIEKVGGPSELYRSLVEVVRAGGSGRGSGYHTTHFRTHFQSFLFSHLLATSSVAEVWSRHSAGPVSASLTRRSCGSSLLGIQCQNISRGNSIDHSNSSVCLNRASVCVFFCLLPHSPTAAYGLPHLIADWENKTLNQTVVCISKTRLDVCLRSTPLPKEDAVVRITWWFSVVFCGLFCLYIMVLTGAGLT